MVLGMSLATYTLIHVVISLVAIASGLVVFMGMIANKRMDALTALFLAATVLTSVTGFFFGSSKGSQAKDAALVGAIPTTITTTTPAATTTTTTPTDPAAGR